MSGGEPARAAEIDARPESREARARACARREANGRGRIRRLVRTMVLLFVAWVGLVCVWSAGFIGVKCYSSAPASRPPAVPPPDGIAGYARPEAFTYLTLPEWFIVYSTDEYARLHRDAAPERFPLPRFDAPVLGLLFDRLRRDETQASVRDGLPRDARRDRRQLHHRELVEVRLRTHIRLGDRAALVHRHRRGRAGAPHGA